MAKKRKTQKEIIEALRANAGVISHTAKALDMSRQWLSTKIHSTPELENVLVEIDEENKDLAENIIVKALTDGDKDIARWYLARKGRDRGYGERLEVENKTPIRKPDLSKLTAEELDELEAILKKSADDSSD